MFNQKTVQGLVFCFPFQMVTPKSVSIIKDSFFEDSLRGFFLVSMQEFQWLCDQNTQGIFNLLKQKVKWNLFLLIDGSFEQNIRKFESSSQSS